MFKTCFIQKISSFWYDPKMGQCVESPLSNCYPRKFRIFVASKASDPILKTIPSHTPRASFASVIFPVKWGWVGQSFGSSRLGAVVWGQPKGALCLSLISLLFNQSLWNLVWVLGMMWCVFVYSFNVLAWNLLFVLIFSYFCKTTYKISVYRSLKLIKL